MKKINFILLGALLLSNCQQRPLNQNFMKLIGQKPYTAIMFIAPDCPLCKTMSTPFSELSVTYPNIQFLAIYSGTYYDPMELNMFATSTKLKPRIFRDYDYAVAHQLKATVTPEFFLIDSSAHIIYRGMMDDRILELGNYKQTWSQFYLKDALEAALNDKKPKIQETEPIGCILEY